MSCFYCFGSSSVFCACCKWFLAWLLAIPEVTCCFLCFHVSFYTLVSPELWEDLLRLRISLQKAMVVINQLPQPDTWQSFMAEAGEPCRQTSSTGVCHLLLIVTLFVMASYLSYTCLVKTEFWKPDVKKEILLHFFF